MLDTPILHHELRVPDPRDEDIKAAHRSLVQSLFAGATLATSSDTQCKTTDRKEINGVDRNSDQA